MKNTNESRRTFIKAAGATALCGICGLPHFACKEEKKSHPVVESKEDSKKVDLLEVREGIFRPTLTGATVHWTPRARTESQVLAGTSKADLRLIKELTSSDAVEVLIDGFEEDTEFFWQCKHRQAPDDPWTESAVRICRTRRLSGTTFQLALFADSHYYSARSIPALVQNISQCMEAVRKGPHDFCVFLGDEAGVHFAGDRDARHSRDLARERWRQWRDVAADLLADVPSFMVLGNHEGEAGFYQEMEEERGAYLQRWGTIERKRHFLNPVPLTYPEGGENEYWRGTSGRGPTGGAEEGNCSPLQNYFAWTWGDALFVVLDVHRYTNVGKGTPQQPEDWTLGQAQLDWFERVATKSSARWKFVIAHHVVGGSEWSTNCKVRNSGYAYGRGGARYARVGEQSKITDIMKRAGCQFFVYGHDHIFAHQQDEGIHYVCCGRPTFVPSHWADEAGFVEAYGDHRARDPYDFFMDVGYTRLTVGPEKVAFEYIKTGMDPKGAENIKVNVGDVVHRFEVT